jgi:hypothetical protein
MSRAADELLVVTTLLNEFIEAAKDALSKDPVPA